MTDFSGATEPEPALWALQGGGYGTETAPGKLIWHEVPSEWQGTFKVGDPVPEEWDAQPANDAARDVLYDDELYI